MVSAKCINDDWLISGHYCPWKCQSVTQDNNCSHAGTVPANSEHLVTLPVTHVQTCRTTVNTINAINHAITHETKSVGYIKLGEVTSVELQLVYTIVIKLCL